MPENRMLVVIALLSSLVLCTAQISVNLSSAELPSTVNLPIDASSTEEVPPVVPTKLTTKHTTTTMPTTTTSSTTTTTTTPNPTTTTTTTTTETPTTTSTTTAAPITTPTPTPHPTPNPEPDVLIINSTCILAKMAVQLNFSYETKDNQLVYGLYNIPKSVFVEDAICTNSSAQRIQIHWGPLSHQHIMALQFDSDNKTSNLTMMMFTLPLTEQEFPNARKNQTIQLIHRGFDFIAPLHMSYHCTRPQMFNLTATIYNNETVGTAKFHDVQVEAFRGPKATGFSEARDCDGIDTSDVVPIAVGVALASLIIIVLISYLCARRRSTSRGYMSF